MSARTRQLADPPILIVEDKDSLRTMLRHALEAQGHTVIEARDQSEAEAALVGKPADAANFRKAAEAALRDAKPQSENGFKIELAKRCLTHALRMATAS